MVGTITFVQLDSISLRMSGFAIAAALLIASSTMINELLLEVIVPFNPAQATVKASSPRTSISACSKSIDHNSSLVRCFDNLTVGKTSWYSLLEIRFFMAALLLRATSTL